MGDGAQTTTIDANQIDRVFHLIGDGQLTIDELTTTGGLAQNGGAILMQRGLVNDFSESPTLIVRRSAIGGNRATSFGGAIHADGGTLTIEESLLVQNSAASGGAIYTKPTTSSAGELLPATSQVTIKNSTVSTNQATDAGGGLWISDLGEFTVIHSTIAKNTAFTAGGILNDRGAVSLGHTIVAGNDGTSGNSDVDGAFTSLGHNLIGDVSGATGFEGAGDLVGNASVPLDPLLGILQDNGGATETHALLPASPAIDAGDENISAAPLTDQRDQQSFGGIEVIFSRIADGSGNGSARIDIGAYERHRRTFTVNADEYSLNGVGTRNVVVSENDQLLSVVVNDVTAVNAPIYDDTISILN